MSDDLHHNALVETGFWGRQGAGLIFRARPTGRLLLARRSGGVQDPGTWGTWGGAVDPEETPEAAARREALEEAGLTASSLTLLFTYLHHSGFRYTTFLAELPHEIAPELSWEADAYAWVRPGAWPAPLHFGLHALLADPLARARLM